MPDRIRPRGDTAANWTSANPILQDREIGLETDTRRYKIGDGTTAWNSLSYNQIGDRYYTLSSTPETIGNGAKTFTVSAGLAYTPQQAVQIVATAAPANHMHGTVTSYSGTTLVVQVDKNTGTGSFSSWTINVGGVTGAALSSISIVAGNGLSGGGTLDASRTVQLAVLSPSPAGTFGSSSQIATLGVNIFGQVISASAVDFTAPNIQVFSSSGTWTKPANAKRVRVQLWGGGGGGGAGCYTPNGSIGAGGGGGGSGGFADHIFNADFLTSPVSVTIGASGAGGSSMFVNTGTNGGSGGGGGQTSFGSFLFGTGGGGGGGGVTGVIGTPAGTSGAGSLMGNPGGAASATGGAGAGGTPTNTTSTANSANGGGGAGGGQAATPVNVGGGSGGRFLALSTSGGTAGTSGGGNGGAGTSNYTNAASGGVVGASGGGGGGSNTNANSGFGGNGGIASGGGGGGAVSGAGGVFATVGGGGLGGQGYAIITTYFY